MSVLVLSGLASAWAVASPLSTGCAAAVAPEQIAPASNETSQFLSRINGLRASKGLASLSVDSNLTSVAQSWAQQMAQNDGISHRSNLASGITIDWNLLGENVGRAPTVDEAMAAFVNSPTHYANLVNANFNRIGVGTVNTPMGLFTAHEFAQVKTAAVVPAPAPAPAPAPTTAPVATKNPVAPTTTSTLPVVVEQVQGDSASTSTTEATASTNATVSDFEVSPASSDDEAEEQTTVKSSC